MNKIPAKAERFEGDRGGGGKNTIKNRLVSFNPYKPTNVWWEHAQKMLCVVPMIKTLQKCGSIPK